MTPLKTKQGNRLSGAADMHVAFVTCVTGWEEMVKYRQSKRRSENKMIKVKPVPWLLPAFTEILSFTSTNLTAIKLSTLNIVSS